MIFTHQDFIKNEEITTDVVVVGSGCGGSVPAWYLADMGLDVIVCEEGSHYSVKDYGTMKPTESFKHLYRDYGGTMAQGVKGSPMILIQQGKMVGGSSVVNGGVCFRTPEYIIDHWRDNLGLTEFRHEDLDAAFTEVEKINHIRTMPTRLNNNGVRQISRVVKKKGWEAGQIQRNTHNCDGANRCVYGCPHDAKKNVLITYLKMAGHKGANIIANLKITKVHHKGRRATGVSGYITHPVTGRRLHKIRIRAKLVIMAASSLYTPRLLRASGLGKRSKQLGRNLTLHPAFRMYGVFGKKLESWKGAFQTYTIEEFRKEGIHLINLFLTPNFLAGTLPGLGRPWLEVMREMPHLALLGFMMSDSSTGRVLNAPWGGPLVFYHMNRQDREKAVRGLKIAARLMFEAGARKVYFPFFVNPEYGSPEEVDKIELGSGTRPGHWEVTSAHPMGTCRIGKDPRSSVLDPWHRLHELDNLYVTDSSAVPTSVAVNPQVTIMGMATRVAWRLMDKKPWLKD